MILTFDANTVPSINCKKKSYFNSLCVVPRYIFWIIIYHVLLWFVYWHDNYPLTLAKFCTFGQKTYHIFILYDSKKKIRLSFSWKHIIIGIVVRSFLKRVRRYSALWTWCLVFFRISFYSIINTTKLNLYILLMLNSAPPYSFDFLIVLAWYTVLA